MIPQQLTLDELGGHGILTEDDLPSLSAATVRIYQLMSSGAWYTANDIEYAAGQREGLRRMRDLRKIEGITIERKRARGNRAFSYRMVRR
jgi:hypothetical protein